MQILMSLAGMTLILLIAYVLSSDRKAIRPRVVLSAFALQAGLAALFARLDANDKLAAPQVAAAKTDMSDYPAPVGPSFRDE